MTKRCTKKIPDGCDNWKPGSSGLRCGWIDYCGICNLAELKKCEDCGGVPVLKQTTGIIYYRYECECGMGKELCRQPTEKRAAEAWNNHAKTPPTRGELEAEVERLKAEVVSTANIQIDNCLRWYPQKQEWECIFCIKKSNTYQDMVHHHSCYIEDLKKKLSAMKGKPK
jgi:hypothetical protein